MGAREGVTWLQELTQAFSLTNDEFVSSNETVVGAWNSICGVAPS